MCEYQRIVSIVCIFKRIMTNQVVAYETNSIDSESLVFIKYFYICGHRFLLINHYTLMKHFTHQLNKIRNNIDFLISYLCNIHFYYIFVNIRNIFLISIISQLIFFIFCCQMSTFLLTYNKKAQRACFTILRYNLVVIDF